MFAKCIIVEDSESDSNDIVTDYFHHKPPNTENKTDPKQKDNTDELNKIISASNSMSMSQEEKLSNIHQKKKKRKDPLKKTSDTIGDVSIQTFFLIGLLSQHVTVHFTVKHSPDVDAAFPHLTVINLENDAVCFDDYLKTIFTSSITPKDLILTTNNYIQDIVSLFGYSFSTEVNHLYEKIECVEKDDIPYMYHERICSIGTELHNVFYDTSSEIILNHQSPLILELFD